MVLAVSRNLAELASQKIATGTLMTLCEVAAMLDIAPTTVHRLPLPSIRIGRSLRFAPQDLLHLIESSKEPVLL